MKNSLIFKVTLCAVMAAMSLVLDKFGFTLSKEFSITFYAIPLLFAGIVLGSKYGFLTGLITGVVEQLTSPYGLSIESIFWGVAPILWGGLSGILNECLLKINLLKKRKWLLYAIVIIVTSLAANVSNTIAITVGNYLLTKDFNQTFIHFFGIVFSRMITLPVMICINTIITYIVCERCKTYIFD